MVAAQLGRLLAKGIAKAGRDMLPDITVPPTILQAQKITPDVVDTSINVPPKFPAAASKEVESEPTVSFKPEDDPITTPQQINAFYKLPETQRQQQLPELEEAAEKLSKGDLSKKDWDDLADYLLPLTPLKEMPDVPSTRKIDAILFVDKDGNYQTGKAEKYGIVGKEDDPYATLSGKSLDGERLSTRLHIPAYDIHNTWTVTFHDGGTKNKKLASGRTIGYGQSAVLNDVEFTSNEQQALDIARRARKINKTTGKIKITPKSTIARMNGFYEDMSFEDVYRFMQEELRAMNSPDYDGEWSQVGMNPYRHSYFYNKKNGKPVLKADRVMQIGPLVLARNVEEGDPLYVINKEGKKVLRKFEEGGVVDMRDGGRVRARSK
jgi:hypothetical protein